MSSMPGGPHRQGRLFIISGPSGSGKTSLIRVLTKTLPNLHVSISYTTRNCRPGEQAQVDYCFVDRATFRRMIESGELLEHAEIFGHYYGTDRSWVNRTLDRGRDVLLEIDWQGARLVHQQMAAVGIFVLPPRIDVLRSRLQARGQDSEEAIQERIQEALEELSHYSEYDGWVINDDFDQAVAKLREIIRSTRRGDRPRPDSLDRLVDKLMEEARRLR